MIPPQWRITGMMTPYFSLMVCILCSFQVQKGTVDYDKS